MVGGPASATPEAVPGTVTATKVSTAGPPADACNATAAADGTFTLVLAPGTYRFRGRSPRFAGGRVDCAADGNVVILAPSPNGVVPNGQNMFVDVDCQRR
jgi:hypothetical protein